MGLAMAVTAVITRRIGEQTRGRPRVTAVQAIIVALRWRRCYPRSSASRTRRACCRADGRRCLAIEHGYRYTQWMLGGNAVIMLLFVINAIFRGAGDAAIAMRVLWLSNG